MENKTIALLAVLLVAVAAGGSLGIAYAQGNGTSVTTTPGQVAVGVPADKAVQVLTPFAGLFWGGVVYALKKNKEKFDPGNFLPTVILGVAITGVAQILGQDIGSVEALGWVQLFTILLDKFVVSPVQTYIRKKGITIPTNTGTATVPPPG